MASNEVVVRMAECRCCGMCEECTTEYIRWVKDRFAGVWVCGLCEEAVKDEQARLGVGLEAAMLVHAEFREDAARVPAIHIARSLIQLLKKMISSSSSSASNSSLA